MNMDHLKDGVKKGAAKLATSFNTKLTQVRKRVSKVDLKSPNVTTEQQDEDEDEIVIGAPQGMRNHTHMAIDKRATWGISGLPDAWRELLEKSGLNRNKILDHHDKAIAALKFATGGQYNAKLPLLTEKYLNEQIKSASTIGQINPATRYKKLAKIGEGAGGVVYKIQAKGSGDILAVKISPIEELKFIKKEIAFHAMSDKHENIVNYHETFKWKSDVWIVMDLIDGGSLTDILGENNPIEWSEPFIAFVMLESLKALEFMHNLHLLHRDIKSDNVLVGRDGTVKLADFGFAVGLSKEHAKRKSTVGTPFWMAPEVIEGVEYDERCDIWSLGVTAIELVNHEPPHMDKSHVEALLDILTSPPPRPNQLDYWSDSFLDFLDQALKKDFNERANAGQLLKHRFLTKKCGKQEFSDFVVKVLDEKENMESEDEDDI